MNREGKKCVLYPRVSTEMQVDGYSLEGQKNGIKTNLLTEKKWKLSVSMRMQVNQENLLKDDLHLRKCFPI